MRIRYEVSKNSEKARRTSAFNTYVFNFRDCSNLVDMRRPGSKFSLPMWPAVDQLHICPCIHVLSLGCTVLSIIYVINMTNDHGEGHLARPMRGIP